MTRDELLIAYADGKRVFQCADLRRATLCYADLAGADLRYANLCDANLAGANLRCANLRGANLCGADLRAADLAGADLAGADLCDANLRCADLCDANLAGANLRYANLAGANLRCADLCDQWVVQGATRSDGYQFLLTSFVGEGVRVKAGCRNFTLEQAREHWQATRAGTALGDETFAILANLEALARARKLI